MASNEVSDEVPDPVVVLGERRNALMKRRDHLAKQWSAAASADKSEDAVDLTAEVENEVEGVLAELRALERKIAGTNATTPSGLLIKLRLLPETCDALAEQWEEGDPWEAEELPDDDEGESGYDPESDPLAPPSMRQNIELVEKLANSLCENAEELFSPDWEAPTSVGRD